MDRWCATVGAAALDTLPEMRAPRSLDSLVVISWNSNVGGGDVLGFLQDQFGVTCRDPDTSLRLSVPVEFVLLLQEAHRQSEHIPPVESGSDVPDRIVPEPRPGTQLDVVELADRCGLALVYVPSARNGHEFLEDKGNAILSTLPLREPLAIELPFEAGRKVAVGATVFLAPTDSLRLVSVHLDVASTLARAITTGNSWRLRQGLGLVEGLTLADGDPQIATIVAGDFNTWTGDETVVRHMYDYFPESPPQGKPRTRGAFPTDYLFFRNADTRVTLVSGPEILKEDYYSDHLPLVAVLRATRSGPPGP